MIVRISDTFTGSLARLTGDEQKAVKTTAFDLQLNPESHGLRVRMVQDVDELRRALKYPWEKWTVFLPPARRELAERTLGGPARVSGSAGTGKTIGPARPPGAPPVRLTVSPNDLA